MFLALLGVAGCGSSGTPPAPNAPPPTGAPPTPQQVGTVTISPQNVALAAGQTTQFTAKASGGGAITWSVNGVAGGNSMVGTVDAKGNYTAPVISQSTNAVVQAALTSAPTANYATATVALMQPGQVQQTANPQVALYSMYLPQPGTVTVQFGTDTGYGLETWAQPSPSTPVNYGGQVNVEVAGMRGSTNYHMQALVTLANGVTYKDSDRTFTTGAPPQAATVQVIAPGGQTPQAGIELFDTVLTPVQAQAVATDLQGNVIWTYGFQAAPVDLLYPIKPMPNGHFLALIANLTVAEANDSGNINVIREIDLAGNTIHELSIAALNQSLAANGYNLTLAGFHHDVLPLPNGHILLLTNMVKPFTNLPGYPGTENVVGDVLVDVDQNYKPDWVWSTFDHLDVNRHPFRFPDWTHGNALLYSADDHNLLFSMPFQNWIIKIDFQDGQGNGNVLWHLGEGGDFKLVGGIDPTDWFYIQHGMNFFSQNTTGVFKLGMMDDGDDRMYPTGVICGTTGAPACYTTVPVLQLDEQAMTATLMFHYIAPPNLYSYFGGNAELLANGDIEANFCSPKAGASIFEWNPTQPTPQVVWQANTPTYDQYRAFRIPSLYPGVQW